MSTTDLVFGTQYYRPPFPNRETWSSDLSLIAVGFRMPRSQNKFIGGRGNCGKCAKL